MVHEDKFHSSNDTTKVHYVEHTPAIKPEFSVVILHGIGQCSDCFDEFANFLTDNGVVVFAMDFIGHGKSVSENQKPMYFGENGWDFLVKDLVIMNKIVKDKYPRIPCYIMGFSMGSFVLRTALAERAKELDIDGAIIAGTGSIAAPVAKLVKLMIASEAKKCGGADVVSEKVNALAFGNYNKHFAPCKTECDWLIKNPELRQEYIDDPKTYKYVTPGMFGDLIGGMARVSKKSAIKNTKRIPLLFQFGDEDPVGGFGKAVRKLADEFRANGFKATSRSYANSRHDIFHDNDQEKVYMDMLVWMQQNAASNLI